MTVANQRRHNRVKHQANIQVVASAESYTLEMRDFSDSGLYLFCDNTSIVAIQEQVKVQTLEFDGAPVLEAEVVRLEENVGFAVEFIQ
jgi:hypothetical protein